MIVSCQLSRTMAMKAEITVTEFCTIVVAVSALGVLPAPAPLRAAGGDDRDGIELFETSIRPVLIETCARCHRAGEKPPKGGLALDTPAGLLRGGDSGPAVVPGDPEPAHPEVHA